MFHCLFLATDIGASVFGGYMLHSLTRGIACTAWHCFDALLVCDHIYKVMHPYRVL